MRLLLLAQSPVLRIGLRGILESSRSFDHVIEVNNALEATQFLDSNSATLTIIQDSLPGVTGVVAARLCRERQPESVIIVLSERSDPERARTAIEYGANALLAAEIEPGALIRVVQSLFVHRISATADSITPVRSRGNLDGGEIAVLDGLVRGLSVHDIAGILLLGEHAVRTLTSNLFHKLNAADRTTAVVAAVRAGLVDLSVHLPIHLPIAPSVASPAESFG